MSYILDALKKAEADRSPETRAAMALAQHDRQRNRLLVYGLVVALIVNVILLLWLFLPREQDAASSQPAAQAQSETQSAAAPPGPAETAAMPGPQTAAATGTSITTADSATRLATPPATTAPAADTLMTPSTRRTPQSLRSLPTGVQRRFPSLEFSTHVYADAPDLRAIVVNGTRLTEGERLGALRLEEITEEGAVFAFEDYLVDVSVLDGWN